MTQMALFQTQVINKAWEDPSFKALLLTDPKKAIKDALGVIIPEHIKLRTLEESSDEFYLVLPSSPSNNTPDNVQSKAMW
ncbi:NHLP leader peptide family RiPP precursor [Paenibacillus crassostreae]|uniref:NHLP leader peptide family natural product n=1 Tax=Paenibacillus crassostreae TaxID=1763538 RepID=A0A167GRV6_9BACL|nr:NHLP leader peptide family RiPP precursor [Paenibacillus crassostreae]AOZ92034.1 NHLP leader peptide family natural product precursor [Paenibacillus crassostreae]OAB77843.1 NHLP leader peptide family natural product precursor [Paenibacillus crassostreae]